MMETVKHCPPGLEDTEVSLGVPQMSIGMDEVTEVRIFSLISPKQVLEQLRMMAVILGVTAKPTSTKMRQLIES